MLLPLPFARVLCAFGEPIPVPRDADDLALEVLRERLEGTLHRMTEALDQQLGLASPGVRSTSA
jgi:lysophospholipid acyltransferase (LPLAT)-like uncharacterized protein